MTGQTGIHIYIVQGKKGPFVPDRGGRVPKRSLDTQRKPPHKREKSN